MHIISRSVQYIDAHMYIICIGQPSKPILLALYFLFKKKHFMYNIFKISPTAKETKGKQHNKTLVFVVTICIVNNINNFAELFSTLYMYI